MTPPLPLLVPHPAMAFEPVAGAFAPLEAIVAVSFSAVRFPDGTAMSADEMVGAAALLTRVSGPGHGVEVWDPEPRQWRSIAAIDWSRLGGVALLPPKTGSAPWHGVLVGAGQKDAAGQPLVSVATGGFPQYRLRGAFHARRGAVEGFGIGPEGAVLQFASAVNSARLGTQLTPDAASATRVQIVLRNGSAQPAGLIEIDASGGNAALTLRNFSASGQPLATVALAADGAIRLSPAPGMAVIVAGNLEAEQIRYLPSGGLPKKTLS